MADPKLEKQLETYFTKGDSLYSIFADPSTPVFEKEGEYPDIPLFTEKGEWSPEWDERGLSDVSREGNVISGINVEGEPVRRTINRSTWGAPSRQQYLSGKMGALDEDLPWEVQKDLRSAALSYGFHDKPKYSSKGNVISPFQMLQFHREKTKGMDPFEEMSFDRDYRNMLEHMPTEKPTIDDRAFDLMKKGANE